MKVLFIRHLPTSNNLSDVFIGRLDLDCDTEYINKHKNDILVTKRNIGAYSCVYCSPLQRAKNTARLLFQNSNIILDERLIERDLGKWSNVSKKELRVKFPDAFYDNGRLVFSYTPQEGEEFRHLVVRVSKFLIDIGNKFSDFENVVVITHNGVITTVKCIMTKNFTDTSQFAFQKYLEPYEIEVNADMIDYLNNIVSDDAETVI